MNPKPGYKSTELWFAVGSAIAALLVATGTLGSEEADTVGQALAILLSLALPTAAYSIGRSYVKGKSHESNGK